MEVKAYCYSFQQHFIEMFVSSFAMLIYFEVELSNLICFLHIFEATNLNNCKKKINIPLSQVIFIQNSNVADKNPYFIIMFNGEMTGYCALKAFLFYVFKVR